MIPCITIGDSIAAGVGPARPDRDSIAKVGITSGRYAATLLPPGRTVAGTAVISLGVNDGDTAATLENFRLVRSRVEAASVVWLLPGLKEEVRDMIRTVAEENGDRLIDTRPQVGPDLRHPTRGGYARIAAAAIGPVAAEPDRDPGVEVAAAPDESPATPRAGRGHPGRTARHARMLRHGRSGAGTGAASRHAAAAAHRGATRPLGATRIRPARAACPAFHCQGRLLRG